MKPILAFVLLAFVVGTVNAEETVNGYYRKDGTYVQPYHRSDPDNSKVNNWSTQGNSNPYTGKPGEKKP